MKIESDQPGRVSAKELVSTVAEKTEHKGVVYRVGTLADTPASKSYVNGSCMTYLNACIGEH